ncbi:DUF4238 domain-containing protein [Undibacterium sp. LX40W]|uniref:DUF4238 domain-containing protein n=1 Tax=Undibacterium nitidum TaxID=2762298 RepID=A0A923KR83_9BURK|nr:MULTISPECIES: DUF4238 domain-containing protein [Undibacterium]MBC3879946.1 DUF4238 domain-containing protein [Undibacterium nitidum]MBC3891318.1 DUF4238 domain-containing protein [Undibacterium sp. LX40W]
MTGEARIHHWVPQCYLKGFAKSHSKKAQLNVIDISARKSFIANPRNIASARDFNRISVKGFAANQIEENYAVFEGKLARALQWMWVQRQLGKANDFNLLLNLIALLAVRNPRMRENVRDFHERVIKKMMHMTVDSEQMYESTFNRAAKDGYVASDSKIDYFQMKDFIGSEKYSIAMSTSGHVERELKLIDTVLPLLGRRHWMLMRASPDSGGFITSDHPVCLIWSEQRKRSLFDSPGFGLKGTEVVFPVSHDLAVVGTFEMQLGEIDITLDQVALVNGIIVAHAERQVYSRDDKFFYTLADRSVHRGADLLRNFTRLSKKY